MVKFLLTVAAGTALGASTGATNPFAPTGTCKWLPWGAWAECRGVCGSGVQTRVRRCLNGIAGSCCQGRTLDSRSCSGQKDDTCSYWSGWGQWSDPSATCGPMAQKCKRRTCYGRGTDHCHGPTTACEGVPIQDPPPVQESVEPNLTCCPYDDRDCCKKAFYDVDVCKGTRTLRPDLQAPCDKALPCCSEKFWGPPGPQDKTCGLARKTRHQYDRCNPTVIVDTEVLPPFDAGMGSYGEWDCDCCTGPLITLPSGTEHQCAGTKTSTRSHSCYDDICNKSGDQVVKTPYPHDSLVLDCHKMETCGTNLVDRSEWRVGPWDKTDEECKLYCKTLGVKKSRTYTNPCDDNDTFKEEVDCFGIIPIEEPGPLPCAGPTSPICKDANDKEMICGGKIWEFTIDRCVVDVNSRITYLPPLDCPAEESGPAKGLDTWGAWGQWSTNCPATYPEACVPVEQSRNRQSCCGVLDAITGTVAYNQVGKAMCVPPAKPSDFETIGQWSAWSAECIDAANPKITRTRTMKRWCETEYVEAECHKNPVSCCVEPPPTPWGPCMCDADITNFKGGIQKRTNYQCDKVTHKLISFEQPMQCVPPTDPRRGPSDWSVCINKVTLLPDECGIHRQYTCPKCEDLSPTCAGIAYDYKPCAVPPAPVTCGPCKGSCTTDGSKTCTQTEKCSGKVIKTWEEPCARETCKPAQWTRSQCYHDENNTQCPGTEYWDVEECRDWETQEVCVVKQHIPNPCGPTSGPVPVCTETSWVPAVCTAPNCFQTCTLSDMCNPSRVIPVQTRACTPASEWTVFGQWSTCSVLMGAVTGQPELKFFAKTITTDTDGQRSVDVCRGTQRRERSHVCIDNGVPRASKQYEIDDCGIEVRNILGPLSTTSVEDFCKQPDERYLDCQKDSSNEYLWSACSADCDASPKRPLGSQTLVRKARCATDANWRYGRDEIFSRECRLDCRERICDPWKFTEWSACSSNCDVGHRHRHEERVCRLVRYTDGGVAEPIPGTEQVEKNPAVTENCGYQRGPVEVPSTCTSAKQCGIVNGAQVYCGVGSKTITIYAEVHPTMKLEPYNCPASMWRIKIGERAEECPLVNCPAWDPFQGPSCLLCEATRVLTRSCNNRAPGQETCPCDPDTDGDAVTKVEACSVTTEWGKFDAWSKCSSPCRLGHMTRHRHRICFTDQIQKEVANCTGSEVEDKWFALINTAIDPTPLHPELGWSACSRSECEAGVQTRTLRNTCDYELTGRSAALSDKIESRTCTPTTNFPGVWMEWTAYTNLIPGVQSIPACPADNCGGSKYRTRQHSCKKYNGRQDQTEIVDCAITSVPGPWGAWGTAPVTCQEEGLATPMVSRQRLWTCNGKNTEFELSNGIEYESKPVYLPSCCKQRWGDWTYTKCSCLNKNFGSAARVCIDETDKCKCAGDSTMSEIRCDAPELQAGTITTTVTITGDASTATSAIFSLGYSIRGVWGAWSTCPAICDISGRCDESVYQQKRTLTYYCVDGSKNADGTEIRYPESYTKPEVQPCPCVKRRATIAYGTCSSPDAATCPGIIDNTISYTCDTNLVNANCAPNQLPYYGANGAILCGEDKPIQCGKQGTWGAWGGWGECSATCDGGTKARVRSFSCQYPAVSDQTERANCNENPCNYYGAWSNFGACSVSCGVGTMTRTRYCHGGNDGTGHCTNDIGGMDACDALKLGGAVRLGKTECRTCDMGACCEWDWSGWTGCCNSGAKNIRLRFRGNKCGQDWQILKKDCETAPYAYTGQTAYPSCEAIKTEKLWRYGQTGNAKYLSVVNPDTVQTTVQQGTKLGHADDPNVVSTYTWSNGMTPTTTVSNAPPAPVRYTDTRTQVPYNVPTNTVQQPTTTTMNHSQVPAAVLAAAQAEAAKSKPSSYNPVGFMFNH